MAPSGLLSLSYFLMPLMPPNQMAGWQVILDIPDSGAYYVFDGDNVTTEEITAFIEDYDEERLERKELQEDAEGGEGDGAD